MTDDFRKKWIHFMWTQLVGQHKITIHPLVVTTPTYDFRHKLPKPAINVNVVISNVLSRSIAVKCYINIDDKQFKIDTDCGTDVIIYLPTSLPVVDVYNKALDKITKTVNDYLKDCHPEYITYMYGKFEERFHNMLIQIKTLDNGSL